MRDGKAKPLPDLARLNELFAYDPITGIVIRKIAAPKSPIGVPIGTRNSVGALICRADYQIIYVHRLAWALYYGTDAPPVIDHINRNRLDNRINNLREATVQQNSWNRGGHRMSKSKVKGAHWSSIEKKWRSSIKVNGQSKHLGWFSTKDEAAAAYRKVELETYGEFATL